MKRLVAIGGFALAVGGLACAAVFVQNAEGTTRPGPQPVHPDVCSADVNDCTPTEKALAETAVPEDIFAGRVTISFDGYDAINAVRGLTAELPSISRVEAKKTTWLDYMTAVGADSLGSQVPGNRDIWLVAVSGKIVPAYGRGLTYSWGVMAYDAATGMPLGLRAGPGDWPDFFDSLQDLSTK